MGFSAGIVFFIGKSPNLFSQEISTYCFQPETILIFNQYSFPFIATGKLFNFFGTESFQFFSSASHKPGQWYNSANCKQRSTYNSQPGECLKTGTFNKRTISREPQSVFSYCFELPDACRK